MSSPQARSFPLEPLLTKLWERSLPLVLQRLDTLDEAAAAARAGTCAGELRDEALAQAHNLAGSLGMFGYSEGTKLAQKIELLLGGTGQPPAQRLSELTKALRAAVFPEK